MSIVNSGDIDSRMLSISESEDKFQANPGQQQRPVTAPERSTADTGDVTRTSWKTARTDVMKKYDLNNDGKFDGQEVENIVNEYINTLNKHANLSESHQTQKRIIAFGAVMIILLSLSNLGTAFLAVSLAKETRIIDGKMVNNDGTQSAVSTETTVKNFSGIGLPPLSSRRRLNADGSRTVSCYDEEVVEEIFETVAVSGYANTVVKDENNLIQEIIPVQGQASRAQDGMMVSFPNSRVRFVWGHPDCFDAATGTDGRRLQRRGRGVVMVVDNAEVTGTSNNGTPLPAPKPRPATPPAPAKSPAPSSVP